MNNIPTLPEPRAADRFLLRPWQLSAEDLALVREAADDDYVHSVHGAVSWRVAKTDSRAALWRR